MRDDERDYLLVKHPGILRAIDERTSPGALKWWIENENHVRSMIDAGMGPTPEQVMDRRRSQQEAAEAYGW